MCPADHAGSAATYPVTGGGEVRSTPTRLIERATTVLDDRASVVTFHAPLVRRMEQV